MKTTAAVLEKTNHPLVIQELDIPALRLGQILVQVAFSGVCHSQLMEARGGRGEDKYLPHLLGHEGSGTVLDIGAGVSKVKPGDQVILGWIKGDGLDGGGAKYRSNDRIINAGGITTFGTIMVISENRCVKLPPGIPPDVAVLFGCALPTGAGIVLNHIIPREGSSIAVFGLGGIGLSALMASTLYNCTPLIAVDIEQTKLQLAMEFGATHTINASSNTVLEEIHSLTGGAGLDYAVEAAGQIASIETAFKSVKKGGGMCVFASHPHSGATISIDPYDLICGKKIEGSWGGSSKPDRDIPKMADLYLQGRLPLEKLLTRRYRLEDINQALDDLEKRIVVRALIDMQ